MASPAAAAAPRFGKEKRIEGDNWPVIKNQVDNLQIVKKKKKTMSLELWVYGLLGVILRNHSFHRLTTHLLESNFILLCKYVFLFL